MGSQFWNGKYANVVLNYQLSPCPSTFLKTGVIKFSQFSHTVLTLPQLSVLLRTPGVKAPGVSIRKGVRVCKEVLSMDALMLHLECSMSYSSQSWWGWAVG